VVLLFTKFDEYADRVRLSWTRDVLQHRGLSEAAMKHILHDLTTKRFDEHIGSRWDQVLSDHGRRSKAHSIPRVCVASGHGGEDEDSHGAGSFDQLVKTTLATLRDRNVKLAFATAQRNSASISTRCTISSPLLRKHWCVVRCGNLLTDRLQTAPI
jgi:hypothetical protein